jgi:hypothetical protein
MPSRDRCQIHVENALKKEDWQVSPRPQSIYIPGRRNPLLADIRASRSDVEIIIAEVKCFEDNLVNELYTSIGQWLVYRSLLDLAGDPTPLYLAIPVVAYHGIFKLIAMPVIARTGIKLLVVDMNSEEIAQWID